MIPWQEIDTVLLDLDGTLLDLRYDNHFWLEHVPRRWAEANGVPFEQARRELFERYRGREGTLAWYCVDHWSRELGLDIPQLKEEVAHLVAVHPHVEDFLAAVRDRGRRAVLVTNAHGASIALKFRRTRIGRHLDQVVSAHEVGHPKEQPGFWTALRAAAPHDPARALLVDDSLPVLRAARAAGIAHLVAVRKPDSTLPEKDPGEFASIRDFREITP